MSNKPYRGTCCSRGHPAGSCCVVCGTNHCGLGLYISTGWTPHNSASGNQLWEMDGNYCMCISNLLSKLSRKWWNGELNEHGGPAVLDLGEPSTQRLHHVSRRSDPFVYRRDEDWWRENGIGKGRTNHVGRGMKRWTSCRMNVLRKG